MEDDLTQDEWTDHLIRILNKSRHGKKHKRSEDEDEDEDSPSSKKKKFTEEEIEKLQQVLKEIRDGYTIDDWSFEHPCTIVIGGPSKCGKTCLVKKIIENQYIQPFPEKVYWFYSEYQDLYKEMEEEGLVTEFIKGLDKSVVDDLTSNDRDVSKLCIFDDLQDEVASDRTIADLFTRGSHLRNLSVIYITQNIFFQGKVARNIKVNGNYYIIFRNPADTRQISDFVSRFTNGPDHRDFVLRSFEEAICEPHGHLIFDFTQNSDNTIRSGIPVKRIFKYV